MRCKMEQKEGKAQRHDEVFAGHAFKSWNRLIIFGENNEVN